VTRSDPTTGHLTWISTNEWKPLVLAQGSRDIVGSEIRAFGEVPEGEADLDNSELLQLARDTGSDQNQLDLLTRVFEEQKTYRATRGPGDEIQSVIFAPGYALDLPVRVAADSGGFGMSIEIGDVEGDEIGVFEWFALQDRYTAVHCYEGKSSEEVLSLEWRQSDQWLEFSRINFLSAVSFRVCLMSTGPPTHETLKNPPIRVTFAAGSWLQFPPGSAPAK
jgi:hypothetical protein